MNNPLSVRARSASSGLPAWVGWLERARQLPVWMRIAPLVAVQLIIGCLDHMAGRGASFFVFYAMPISLMAWVVSRRAGLMLAFASGFIWLAANHANQNNTGPWFMTWVTIGRIVYFSFIAIGTAAMRKMKEKDAAQIQMLNDMRQLELDLVNSREREQQRIGQDLHDGLCQQLAALSCAVQALADDLQNRNAPEAGDAGNIGNALQKTVLEARNLAGGMSSLHVERGGIANALETLVQMTNHLGNVPVSLEAKADVKIENPEIATHLYRIAQEAISNAVRHSGAKQVTVRLGQMSDRYELRIDDDGKGFNESTTTNSQGIGLQTMRYRAHAIGADFIIHPRTGGGTSVRCTMAAGSSS